VMNKDCGILHEISTNITTSMNLSYSIWSSLDPVSCSRDR
jgi:hypothetical protein